MDIVRLMENYLMGFVITGGCMKRRLFLLVIIIILVANTASFADEGITETSIEDITIDNKSYYFNINIVNTSKEEATYVIKIQDMKKTYTLSPSHSKQVSMTYNKSDVKLYPETRLIVLKDKTEILSVSIVDTILRDISNHWSYEAVKDSLIKGNLVELDGIFSALDQPITNRELSYLITNTLGIRKCDRVNSSYDFLFYHQFPNDELMFYSNDFYDDSFDYQNTINSSLTRKNMFLIVSKILEIDDVQIESNNNWSKYKDLDFVDDSYLKSVKQCLASEIIIGKTDNMLYPDDLLTRAEAVTIVNLLHKVIKESVQLGNSNFNLACGGLVAYDDNWDYVVGDDFEFRDSGHNGLYKVNKERTQVQQLTNRAVSNINLDENWLYYTQSDKYDSSGGRGYVYRMKKDGSENEQLTTTLAYDLVAVGDYLYYTLNYHNCDLWRMDKNGENQTLIGFRDVYNLQYRQGFIYFVEWLRDEGQLILYRMNESTFEKEYITEYEYDPKHSSSIYYIDGDWIYYMKKGDLYRILYDGTRDTRLTNNSNLADFYLVDDEIYCRLYGLESVNRNGYLGYVYKIIQMKTDGSRKSVLPYDSDFQFAQDPVGQTESRCFFWNGGYGLQIYEIRFDGNDRQAVLDYAIDEIRNHLEFYKPLFEYDDEILMRIVKKITHTNYMTIEEKKDGRIKYMIHNEGRGPDSKCILDLTKGHLLDSEWQLIIDLSKYYMY